MVLKLILFGSFCDGYVIMRAKSVVLEILINYIWTGDPE